MDAVMADLRAKNPDVPPALWDNYAARINDHSALVRLYAPIYRRHGRWHTRAGGILSIPARLAVYRCVSADKQ